MAREYPLEKIRNIGIIAHISHRESLYSNSLPRTQRFVCSATGKLPFPRPLSRIDMSV